MRRIRSESWTFIWQPKVLMHAVLDPPDAGAREGFLVKGIVGPAFFVLLIFILRLVDAGSQDDLAGTSLDVEPRQLQVARPRRPAQHGTNLREVLGPHREY